MTSRTIDCIVLVAFMALGIATLLAKRRLSRVSATLAVGSKTTLCPYCGTQVTGPNCPTCHHSIDSAGSATLQKLEHRARVLVWCFYLASLAGIYRVIADEWPGLMR